MKQTKISRPFHGIFYSGGRAGVTLTELMVSMVIMSVGILGLVGAFKFFNVSIQSAKIRSLANNIAQERIEFLKNKSYYRVLVTTASASDPNFAVGEMVYDVAPNGPETVNVGGITFVRRVYIRKVNEDSNGNLSYLAWDEPDSGLKEIKVYVVWKERGEWRKLEIRNLRENPARVNESGTIGGAVRDTGGSSIAGVVVRAQENPSKYGETNAAGGYSFTIEPGTYTLLATKDAYFPSTLPSFGVTSGQSVTGKNFTLTQMSSGTITGAAWRRDHLVISQVVGSSVAATVDAEWVEVYNPTTWTWTMATGLGTGGGTGSNRAVIFTCTEEGAPEIFPHFDYRAVSVGPGSYFLFANTGTITSAGITRQADAVYNNGSDWDFISAKDLIDTGNPSSAGHLILCNVTTMTEYDVLGWNATNNGTALKKLAIRYEGAAIVQAAGLEVGEGYTRGTASGVVTAGQGRCYDTQNNNNDFVVTNPVAYQPHNSSDTNACATGTPAAGAVAFADDSLSSPVAADSAGAFNLANVSTGSWTVYVSSGLVFSSAAYFGGVSADFVSAVGNIQLTTITLYGYVTGRVTDVSGSALPGIKMFAFGSPQIATNSSGRYLLPVTAGIVSVAANYQSQSPSYVQLSSTDINVGLGAVVKDVDFSLYYGGRIRGRVTTNGTDPLPNIPVVGFKGGIDQGSGISDSNGYFTISGSGVSTGTYVVQPQLETGESSSPSSTTVVLQAGGVAFSSTYTVLGAFGSMNGAVHTGSLTGPAITTGVLVYVTTSTLAAGAGPPDITTALRGGAGVYYAASSNALGNYTIPIKGGYSYNVYAWYTSWSGTAPAITRKESLAIAVAPAETKTADFFW